MENNRELFGTRLISPDIAPDEVPELLSISKTTKSKKKMERLLKVRNLFYVHKWNVKEIAESLKTTERTIFNHLAELRKVMMEIVSKDDGLVADVNKMLWQMAASYDERIKLLWEHHGDTEDPGDKTNILKEIAVQEKNHIILLQSLGYLPKAADKKFTANITYHSHLGKDDLTKDIKKDTIEKNVSKIEDAEISVEVKKDEKV